jgi:predicted ATPase
VQDAAYATLLRGPRQKLHARIGDILEGRFPDIVEGQPEVLAHHFTGAGLRDKAIAYWQKAGRRAAGRSAHIEAVSHLQKGLDLVRELPDGPERDRRELELQVSLGPALLAAKGYAATETEQAYSRARELIEITRDASWLDAVMSGLYVCYHTRAALQHSQEVAETSLRLAEMLGDPGALCSAHRMLASNYNILGKFELARRHGEQCIACYDPERHGGEYALRLGHDVGIGGMGQCAIALWHLGFPEQSAALAAKALDLAGRSRLVNTRGLAREFSGSFLSIFRRDFSALQMHTEALESIGREHLTPQWGALGTCLKAPALTAAGQPEEAIASIERSIAVFDSLQSKVFRPVYSVAMAEACIALGHFDRAVVEVERGLAIASRTAEHWMDAELWRVRGQALLAGGELGTLQAEHCFCQALDIARQQSSRSFELRAATSLARLWRDQGRRDEACDLLAPIYGRFTEGFGMPDLKDAKAVLDELRE